MPRLIRRRPLAERIRSYLNPLDFLLWLSEEVDANDWDQFEKDWALPLGIFLNGGFLLARANSRAGSKAIDDVFGEEERVPWLGWFASFVVHLLACLSALNAFYTVSRKRHYRMFEASIDKVPTTPSARRVRVDSSPMTGSPLRYLANLITPSGAESRAHPDAQRDVWELAIWDPLPICLRLFCLFSPGHVLVYWLFLPTQLSDPRPSVTIVTTIFLTTLLSVQMSFLSSSFIQKTKDSALVQREVLKEYDTKFVHPRTQPLMRDVGTQFSEENATHYGSDKKYNQVDLYTPAFVIRRGFQTSPNPNYVSHVDPEGLSPTIRKTASTTGFSSVARQQQALFQTPTPSRDASPLVRHSIRQPQFRPTPTKTGDGGSLGIYSHANSPLRKSMSSSFEREMSPLKRASSPLKRSSVPPGMSLAAMPPSQRRETGRF
ncbi:hypothetical protein MPDQ_000653 [Monascus purpureus]|uniref:Nuclear rim protein 1 n=1 Tax=Monascus purpureus TaxID=5098 RepID=A0A507QTG9_MONPU|nr:hypothetical protein MPDQ_000653 [Monascus purpureus]BDD56121.1 hypothetical protein MAP00_001597 [Monascus purpureus]